MTIYFTSDTHFWHKVIVGFCNRPVMDERKFIPESRLPVEGMNELLIHLWNERISPNDDVYFLGDFAFCGTKKAEEILGQLQGRKHWIVGNHDYGLAKKPGPSFHFEWTKDYYVLRVNDKFEDDEGEEKQYSQPIILCHFPILSWDGMSHGSWHLHGHCHGSLPPTKMMRMDVGVDTNNLYPYSYEDIKKVMVMRTIVPVDHHGL